MAWGTTRARSASLRTTTRGRAGRSTSSTDQRAPSGPPPVPPWGRDQNRAPLGLPGLRERGPLGAARADDAHLPHGQELPAVDRPAHHVVDPRRKVLDAHRAPERAPPERRCRGRAGGPPADRRPVRRPSSRRRPTGWASSRREPRRWRPRRPPPAAACRRPRRPPDRRGTQTGRCDRGPPGSAPPAPDRPPTAAATAPSPPRARPAWPDRTGRPCGPPHRPRPVGRARARARTSRRDRPIGTTPRGPRPPPIGPRGGCRSGGGFAY